jgi:hypothetical protein
MLRTRALFTGVLAAGLALAAPSARAGMIATATVDPFGSNFQWTYHVAVQSGVHVQPGDYFTIYDFQGAVPGSDSAPAGWNLTVANSTGIIGSRTTPNDDPNLPNYTWTWTGGHDIQTGAAGDFSLVSHFQQANTSDFSYVGVSHRTDDNRPYQDITSVAVPSPIGNGPPPPPGGGGEPPPGGPPGAPEPATLIMLGCGLPALGLLKLRRRK